MGIICDKLIIILCHYREEAFSKNLWEKMSTHMFENIYLPAAQAENAGWVIDIYYAK